MAERMQGPRNTVTEEVLLIRGEDGAYAVPVAVLEGRRIPEGRRAERGAAMRERATVSDAPGDAPRYVMPPEAFAPYRLPDEQRMLMEERFARQRAGADTEGFAKYAPNQPKGEAINGYTGYAYSVTFGRMERGQRGGSVYIGVFPMFQMPLDPPAQPGMGLR